MKIIKRDIKEVLHKSILILSETMENLINDPSKPMYLNLDELIPPREHNTRQEDEFLKQFLDDIKMDFNEEDEIIMSITQFYYLVNTILTEYEIYRLDNHFKFGSELDTTE
jgi:hypothetical protein